MANSSQSKVTEFRPSKLTVKPVKMLMAEPATTLPNTRLEIFGYRSGTRATANGPQDWVFYKYRFRHHGRMLVESRAYKSFEGCKKGAENFIEACETLLRINAAGVNIPRQRPDVYVLHDRGF